jgi:hypothetical protein
LLARRPLDGSIAQADGALEATGAEATGAEAIGDAPDGAEPGAELDGDPGAGWNPQPATIAQLTRAPTATASDRLEHGGWKNMGAPLGGAVRLADEAGRPSYGTERF